MTAMYRYTRAEFDLELRKLHLVPAQKYYESGKIWATPSGNFISVPKPPAGDERYPDYMLDDIIEELHRLNEN